MMKKLVFIILFLSILTNVVLVEAETTLKSAESNETTYYDTNIDIGSSVPSFTVEAWIKTNDASGRVLGTIKNGVSSYDPRISFGVSNNKAYGVVVWDGASHPHLEITGTSNITDLSWHHIAYTVDVSTKTAKLYVDGVKEANRTNPTFTQFNPLEFYMFARNNQGTPDQYFTGKVDDLRFWTKVKTQSEIANQSLVELTGTETGLLFYYKLNGNFTEEVSGTTGINYSVFFTTDNALTTTTNNLTITVVDNRTDNTINVFNTTITTPSYSYYYSTINGTIQTNVSDDIVNITVRAKNYFNNVTLNYNSSNDYQAKIIKYAAVTAIVGSTGETILNFTANYTNIANASDNGSLSTTTGTIYFPLKSGTYTLGLYDVVYNSAIWESLSQNVIASPYLEGYEFSVYQTNNYNLTILDEQTRLVINDRNITIMFISELEASNYTTNNGTYNSMSLIPSEIELRYNVEDYEGRSYYHLLTNQTSNIINLYLLNQSEGQSIIVTVTDETANKVEGVIVQLLRGYIINGNEEFHIVEMDKTDFGGEAILFVETTDVLYKMKVLNNLDSNTTLFFSDPFEITSTTISLSVIIESNPWESFSTVQGVTYDSSPIYDNTTKLWSFSYDANNNNFAEICLYVNELDNLGVTSKNVSCSTSNSGILQTGWENNRFNSEAKVVLKTISGETILLQSNTWSHNTLWRTYGSTGLFMSMLLVFVGAAMLSVNPGTMIVGAVFAFGASMAMGLIGYTSVSFISLLIIGGILYFNMKT